MSHLATQAHGAGGRPFRTRRMNSPAHLVIGVGAVSSIHRHRKSCRAGRSRLARCVAKAGVKIQHVSGSVRWALHHVQIAVLRGYRVPMTRPCAGPTATRALA